jgi:hypothetical protein
MACTTVGSAGKSSTVGSSRPMSTGASLSGAGAVM